MQENSISTVLALLKKANDHGIIVSKNNDKLNLHFTDDAIIDNAIIEDLKFQKQAILNFLSNQLMKPKEEELSISEFVKSRNNVFSKIPLSFSQERLWFVDKFQKSAQYNLPAVFKINGDLNIQMLEQSFKDIIKRHKVLSSNFKDEDGVPYQSEILDIEWNIKIINDSKTNDDKAINEYILNEIQKDFDLSKDYLIRGTIINFSDEVLLVVVLHHIISDGWSIPIFINELSELYRSKKNNRSANLSVLPVQYSDYSLWQREYWEKLVLEDKLKYWEKTLDGVTPINLPIDYSYPSLQSNNGDLIDFSFSKQLNENVISFSKHNKVSVFMTLLSALKILMYKYTGQNDVCIGTPVANRSQNELENLVGFFVNTIALRSYLNENESVSVFVDQIRKVTLESYSNQDVPFEKVVERVVKDRNVSRSPIFQVLLVLQNEPYAQVINIDDVTLTQLKIEKKTSKFDITFEFIQNKSGLELSIEYCTDLFKQETIERMASHYELLLSNIVDNPHQQIKDLKFLSLEEEKTLTADFNDTLKTYDHDKTLVDLLKIQANQSPDDIALIFDEEELTYRELDERSNQLAHYLQRRGVKKESLVAICIDRSIEMIVGLLGIIKAGGAYVPIDPEYPISRINYMLEDSGSEILLTSSESCPLTLNDPEIDLIYLDQESENLNNESILALDIEISVDNLVYVIYTSGSTGTPKGVMVEHKNIVNRLYWTQEYYGLTPLDKTLQKTSFSFDVSVWEIFWPLISGSKLVLAKPGGQKDSFYLKNIIAEQEITTIHFVPSMLEVFLQDINLDDCRTLKRILCSGEELKKSHVLTFREKLPVTALYNLYGPTEAAVDVTYWQVPLDVKGLEIVPIGQPVSNTSLYILDKDGNTVPIGVVGELFIGGIQVARGYLNLPDLTKERFISSPFQENMQSRLYKTGDLARWLSDGNIEYVGRRDNQVKIRGFRIELGEIESVLQEIPSIKQSIVIAREGNDSNKQLIAYIVSDGVLDLIEVQQFLRTRLPDYMIPLSIISIDEIPLTSNGKINKKALPKFNDSVLNRKEYTEPRNEIEEEIVSIWGELLNIDKISIYDNFFDLGGHSLLAVRVISLIRKRLNIEAEVKQLFINPTVEGFSEYIHRCKIVRVSTTIEKQKRTENIPLSFAQERLWFVDKKQGSVQFHLPVVLELLGNVNVEILYNSFKKIIDRHEILRTVFVENKGEVFQKILKIDDESVSFFEEINTNEKEDLNYLIQNEIDKPFNLSKDLLLRVKLFKLSTEKCCLLLVMHHINIDGWSLPIFVKELLEIYESEEKGIEHGLKELPIQYADFAIWERSNTDEVTLNTKLKFWEEKLKDLSQLNLPTDYPRPKFLSLKGSNARYSIDKELSSKLKIYSKEEGVTLFMSMMAIFKVMLYKYTNHEDICIGTSVANRNYDEIEELIGFFANRLVLRNSVKGDSLFKDFLNQIKDSTLDVFNNQDVSFEKIVERVQPERDLSRNPLFQIAFIFNNNEIIPSINIGELTVVVKDYVQKTSKFDLAFNVIETDSELDIFIEYNTDLFKDSTINRMFEHYDTLISSILTNPNYTIDQLNILGEEEKNKILVEFNKPKADKLYDKSFIELFKEQARISPSERALVFENQILTYKELDQKSSLLANYLLSRNVKSQEIIGVCLKSPLQMVLAILGILKIRSVYLSIDSELPKSRIKFITEDTKLKFVLTDEFCQNLFDSEDDLELINIDNKAIFEENESTKELICFDDFINDDFYIIYTSGSTGKPKGVVISHHNVLDYISGLFEHTDITMCSSFGLMSTMAADLGNTVLFSSLLLGKTLHLFSRESLTNASSMHEYFENNKVDCIKIVPSHWKSLEYNNNILLPKQMVIFGGDKLTMDVIEKIKNIDHQCKVLNHYGPTETTIGKLLYKVDLTEKKDIIPIGKPFTNSVVYILDKFKNPVPIGIAGELFIGGAGISRGYYNQPDLTNDKFIANPFSDDYNGKLYSTGDLVRWLSDGNIEYIDRIDNQVKINGYRVEIGEIEKTLSEVKNLKQNVVIVREEDENKSLVAYVVTDGDFDKELIKQQLKLKLPDYMIPALIVNLESIPLTANGKIDKKVLLEKELSQINIKYVEPRDELEQKLATIWEELLKRDKIGIHHNFFELGGHSLLAIRVGSRIRKDLKKDLSINDLFLNPTIASLSVYIKAIEYSSKLSIIKINERPDDIPLSYSQERLWFIDKLYGSTHYHIPFALKIEGFIDKDVFEDMFKVLINRHEALRTIFIEKNGAVYQEVITHDLWRLEYVENFQINTQDDIEILINQEIYKPFNLNKDYPFRVKIIKENTDQHYMVVVIHHIAADGWSIPILINELKSILESKITKEPQQLNELPIQYSDYTIWQRQYFNEKVLSEKTTYWENKLKNTETLNLPLDYKRPNIQSINGSSVDFIFERTLVDKLKKISIDCEITLFMALLSGLKILMYKYTGQNDVCIGTPVANRDQNELEGLIGFFVNTVVMRSHLDETSSFLEFSEQTKTTCLEAYSNQDVPFEKIVEKVVKNRDLSTTSLFQVLFVFQDKSEIYEINLDAAGLKFSIQKLKQSISKFDLIFNLTENKSGLELSIEYCTDLFKQETIERMASHYELLLSNIVDNPHQKIKDLKFLSLEEEKTLTADFNDTLKAYDHDKTLVDLLKIQAAQSPSAIALIFEEEELTYRELDERSNQLAHYLQRRGVKRESLVAICIDRSIEMIVGLLGIIKAGGAYVPIDPEYPISRINYMLEDSGSEILLTSSENCPLPLSDAAIDLICLDQESENLDNESILPLDIEISVDNLAYVIYTSGSTGTPKGVMVEHKNIVNRLYWTQEYYGLTPSDKTLQKTSFSFDVSVWEIFWPLISGSKLVLAKPGGQKDSFYLKNIITEQEITTIHFVPSMLEVFLQDINLDDCRTLKRVLCSGEELKKSHVLTFREKLPVTALYNLYGPTEAAVDVTYWQVPLDVKGLEIVPIGQPVSNTSLYILDKDGNTVPIGVVGELFIGGIQVARGYLNLPDLTKDRFISNPFQANIESRLYKTGDLARWLSDGTIEYLGRTDNQVKIRGFRIELGEIESVLQEIPGIKQSVVIAREGNDLNKQLIAYIVSDEELNTIYLRDQLKVFLPTYMIPEYFIQLDNIPLNSNGKIDKNILLNENLSVLSSGVEYYEPRNEIEMKMVNIIASELERKYEDVGIDDNFFDLGGTSLKMIKILSKINSEFGLDVKIILLFQYPTIRSLTQKIFYEETIVEKSSSEDENISEYLDDIINLMN